MRMAKFLKVAVYQNYLDYTRSALLDIKVH